MEHEPKIESIISNDGSELKETEKSTINGCSKCDGGYLSNGKICDCLRLTIMKRKYENANIDYDFASLPIIEDDVDAFLKDDDSPEGKIPIYLNAFIDDYVDNVKDHLNAGKGIIFGGPVGRGKSLSAMKILMKLVDKGHKCYFITIKQFLEVIKKSWEDEEAKNTLNYIYNADFIVVDDLGTELHKSDWTLTEIDSLFRHRYYKKLPVIITTNSSLEKLKEKYAIRIISLFHERSLIVPIVSKEDYRQKLSKVPSYVRKDKFIKG